MWTRFLGDRVEMGIYQLELGPFDLHPSKNVLAAKTGSTQGVARMALMHLDPWLNQVKAINDCCLVLLHI
jgi:hypothetical protein